MAFDYTEIQEVAQELIAEFGRSIILRKNDRSKTDPVMPWKGASDIDGDVASDLTVFGVFVPPNTVREFGITSLGEGTEFRDMLAYSQQIIIIAQGDNDIRNYDRVIEDDGYNANWSITATQVLRPGDTYLLGFIGVRR